MSKLRVHSFSISLDGYGVGQNQSRDNPLGVGGEELHDWVIATRTWQRMHGEKGGASGIDDDFFARGIANIGAWIMGRKRSIAHSSMPTPWPSGCRRTDLPARCISIEARIGGKYKMSFTNFTTGKSHSFGGEYLELGL